MWFPVRVSRKLSLCLIKLVPFLVAVFVVGRLLFNDMGWESEMWAAHRLHNAIKTALEVPAIQHVLTTTRRWVGHFKHSAIATHPLMERQKSMVSHRKPRKQIQVSFISPWQNDMHHANHFWDSFSVFSLWLLFQFPALGCFHVVELELFHVTKFTMAMLANQCRSQWWNVSKKSDQCFLLWDDQWQLVEEMLPVSTELV